MNSAGSLAAKSRTTASRPMLARMPIRVEGFIEAPLQGGSYGKRAMITADRKRAADLGQGRASRSSV
jgi:hypothetical protein